MSIPTIIASCVIIPIVCAAIIFYLVWRKSHAARLENLRMEAEWRGEIDMTERLESEGDATRRWAETESLLVERNNRGI